MAYDSSWLSPSKLSGNGNDTVSVSALSDNTGRTARSTVVTFKAANCEDVERTVNQAGKPEFVSFDSATATVAKAGGSVIITGKSNSSKLTFSLGSGGTLNITLPSSYTAAGTSTDNGVAITGDPGSTSEYAFNITISNIAENTSLDTLTKQLIVTDNGSHTATCNISQSAGDPTLSVSPASVDLAWNAYTESGSASFAVTSNTSWTVE